MRSHVFPVCRPSFNKLDVETIDESRSLLAGIGGNNIYYKTTGSDGVQGAANFNVAGEQIVRIDFVIDGDGGEYLLSDISVPSETTLDFNEDINVFMDLARNIGSASNEFYLNRLYITDIQDHSLSAGSVFCFGSKPSTDVTTIRTGPQLGVHEPNNIYNTPFGVFGFLLTSTTTYSSGGNVWVTVMFTGTRWVILGSNSWIS